MMVGLLSPLIIGPVLGPLIGGYGRLSFLALDILINTNWDF